MLGTLRVDDPDARYAAVRLCSDLPLRERDFAREDGAWIFELPPARIARLEYKLELVFGDGSAHIVCDPDNPDRAPGAFGEKSVLRAPAYRAPAWLEEQPVPGRLERVSVRVLARDLEILVWSPQPGALPLLVAHDGPEYDVLSSLTHYAGAMIARDALPPFRVALLPPGERDEWYSASAAYGRALCHRILPALREQIPIAGLPVGMGTSLGALAMLHAHRSWPSLFRGLFLQSGSFFVRRFDAQESALSRFGRITRFVGAVLRASSYREPVPVTMTCGADEENIHNNRLMFGALAEQGYPATLHEVPDLHNYTAWRDAFDPHLTDLLSGVWVAQ